MKRNANIPLEKVELEKKYAVNPLTGEIFSKKSKKSMGHIHSTGYIKIALKIKGVFRTVTRSRVVWAMSNGALPKNMEIDHINSDKTDDRLCNLRLVTHSENQLNMNDKLQTNNTSGIRGVSWHKQKKKWEARIKIRGVRITKYFVEKDDAIHCREAMEIIYL